MECSKVKLKLDEYINNRLDCSEAMDIKIHLENCSGCCEEINTLRELNDILSLECPVYPGDNFTLSIMKNIERVKANRRSFFMRGIPIVNLGASLVLTGLLTIFINTPFGGGIIARCTDSMNYGAATINTSISATTNNMQMQINNIINPGGK